MNIKITSPIKLTSTLLAFSLTSAAFAMPQDGGPPGQAKKGDNYSHPLGKKQKELKQKALQQEDSKP